MTTAKKLSLLLALVVIYAAAAFGFHEMRASGLLEPLPAELESEEVQENETLFFESDIRFRLEASQSFLEEQLVQENGHIDLYYVVKPGQRWPGDDQTNSEALSYYLLWTARAQKKHSFDRALDFIQDHMLHEAGYLMWRLEVDERAVGDGTNIASDADLRAIEALFIAQEQWGDKRYAELIDTLARGLERTAVTDDGYLAPYGGASGRDTWTASEVWLSYTHFTVMRDLAKRRGAPWDGMYQNMKDAVLGAQIANGLYNTELTLQRQYGSGPDAGAYSINSLWIMVRSAESEDQELRASASKALDFYKQRYAQDGALYQSYDSAGNPRIEHESPWVYALVARSAIELGDAQFSTQMIDELLEHQVMEPGLFGAIVEGSGDEQRVGQFTMQESILTLQAFKDSKLAPAPARST